MDPLPFHGLSLATPPEVQSLGWGAQGSAGQERHAGFPFWSLHVYPYHAAWTIGGATLLIHPGCCSLTPPRTPVVYDFNGPCSHFYVHFQVGAGPEITLPTLLDVGPRMADLLVRLEQAQALLTIHPGRTTALVWSVLWDVAEWAGVPGCQPVPEDQAGRVAQILEKRLSAPTRVAVLAAELGISPRHLQRLFHKRYGCSIRAWVAARKTERLGTLLTRTDLSLNRVARAVGVQDRQHFHKLVHRLLGASPGEVRAGSVIRENPVGR